MIIFKPAYTYDVCFYVFLFSHSVFLSGHAKIEEDYIKEYNHD